MGLSTNNMILPELFQITLWGNIEDVYSWVSEYKLDTHLG